MPMFPSSAVPPAELLEGYLADIFETLETPPGSQAIDIALGVRLEGEGGGEWVVELREGRVGIRGGARDETSFTYVQSVRDWQGALWEGRGSWIGRGAAALFRPDAEVARAAASRAGAALPVALEALGEIRGLLGVVVSGSDGDWQVALQLGPGEVPPEPTAVIHVTSEDLDQISAGELKPMEAFMAGRIRVVGDMALLLQIQAAQMQAAERLAGGSAEPA